MAANVDEKVVAGFGDEWTRFDQSPLGQAELNRLFDEYFELFPWGDLPENAVGFDMGCGSGRWAKVVAPRVGELHLIDASRAALDVARQKLNDGSNCFFHNATVDKIPLADESCDFGYSLGVLHHIPNTEAGLRNCISKLKKGAPFLLYLYYRFDNRPWWFRAVWKTSDLGRQLVSRSPNRIRSVLSDVLASVVYFPLARTSFLLEKIGLRVDLIPLAQYRNRSFYTMRTDALDRFGTRLEKRFTKDQIRQMMETAGLENIKFSDKIFWTAVGFKS